MDPVPTPQPRATTDAASPPPGGPATHGVPPPPSPPAFGSPRVAAGVDTPGDKAAETGGDLFERFLLEAAPIVTSERGLTPRATILIESLAGRLGLSEKGRVEAITRLRATFDGETPESKAKAARFRKAIVEALNQRSSGILTARHERELIDQAESRFLIDRQAAGTIVREAAKEVGLKFVPHAEAYRHVEALIREELRDVEALAPSIRERLRQVASEWGLADDEYATLVEELTHSTAGEAVATERRNWGMAIGAVLIVALVAVGAVLYWTFASPSRPSPVKTTPSGEVASGSPATAPGATPAAEKAQDMPGIADFWGADLQHRFERVAVESPSIKALGPELMARDAARRGRAYGALSAEIGRRKTSTDPAGVGLFADLWARAHERETDDASAAALRDGTAALLDLADPLPPLEERNPAAGLWALDVLLWTANLERDGKVSPPATRAGKVEEAIVAKTGGELGDARGGLLRTWLRQIADAAGRTPQRAVAWAIALDAAVKRELTPDARVAARLDIGLRAAMGLESSPHPPGDAEPIALLLREAIDSRDVEMVSRVIDLFETTRDPALKKALRAPLARRATIDDPSIPDLAERVRKKLEATAPRRTDAMSSRRGEWRRLIAENASARNGRDADSPLESIRDATRLAWLTNLGEALLAGDSRGTWFDEAIAAGPPKLEKTGKKLDEDPAADFLSPLPPDQRELFRRYTNSLGSPRDMRITQRTSYFRSIASVADKLKDVPPEVGQGLAVYLTMQKNDEEAAEAIKSATAMRHWSSLLVGLSDQWRQSDLADARLRELFQEMTGDEPPVGAIRGTNARLTLKEVALRRLGESTVAAADGVEGWVAALANEHAVRASFWNAPFVPEGARSIDALESMLRAAATPAESSSPAAAWKIAGLATSNDPERTAALQRACLAKRVESLAKLRPRDRERLLKVDRDLRKSDESATAVARQIRDAENAMLAALEIVNE